MTNWAAIVYGRTYEVDFRLIALPEDFNSEEENWLVDNIRVTTRTAEQLSGNPRWFLFKNERHCVVGVTCMVRELLTPLDDKTKNLTVDQNNRPLYIFVGFAHKPDQQGNFPSLPSYEDLDLQLFKPHYSFVSDLWAVKPYDELSRKVTSSTYKEINLPSADMMINLDEAQYQLNLSNIQATSLWPDSLDVRQRLWAKAALLIRERPQANISLCCGLSTGEDALSGPLLNATAADVRQMKTLPKPVELPPTPKEKPKKTSKTVRRRKQIAHQTVHRKQSQSTIRLVSILGGATVGGGSSWLLSTFLGVNPFYRAISVIFGTAVGGVVGSTVAELLESKKQQDTSLRDRASSVSSSNRQAGLQGFKEKVPQDTDDDSSWKI